MWPKQFGDFPPYNNMKKIFSFAVALFSVATISAQTRTVLAPQLGKQVVEVAPGEVVNYLDFKGYGSLSRSSDYAFSTTIFKPTEAGYTIYIHFDTIHAKANTNNNPASMKIYSGVFDTLSVTYPATASAVDKVGFPHTDALLDSVAQSQTYGGMATNLDYLSPSADGALSCCFHWRSGQTSYGFNATVYCVATNPQTITDATADYSQVPATIFAGEANVNVGAITLTTTGAVPVDTLTSVSFTLSDNTVFDPASFLLYEGNVQRPVAPTASNPRTGVVLIPSTLTESEGVYTLACKYALKPTNNILCIGANVLPTAAWDATPAFTLTSVTTKKATTPAAAVTPTASTVEPLVLLEPGKDKTIDVNRTLRFCDDGGPEKQRTDSDAVGTVTFRPTTAGQRVQISFSTISILWTTSYKDSLFVYNGLTTAEDSLLFKASAQSAKNMLVKSTAVSGALTVRYVTRKVNSSNARAGWDAQVSEYTPQDMIISGSAVEKPKATVSAGTTDVQVLHFTLTAANTEHALQPMEIALTTNNTYAAISHVRLYYTGSSSKFATTTLLGEADVEDNTIVLDELQSVTFIEGDHHFFVVADIAAAAQTGNQVDLNVQYVAFADATSYVDFATPAAAVTVENKILSVCGEKTYTISGAWLFAHTPESSGWAYPEATGYDQSLFCNQITTFTPASADKKVQMAFSEFGMYYPEETSFDTHATRFVVYNGKDTTATVLFQLTDEASYSAIPATLQSTAADGSLTVLFNANPTADGMAMYNGKGWKATVSEYGTVTSMEAPADSTSSSAARKYLSPNRHLIIERDGARYTITGQRL